MFGKYFCTPLVPNSPNHQRSHGESFAITRLKLCVLKSEEVMAYGMVILIEILQASGTND